MNRLIIFLSFYGLFSLTSCASAKQNAWLKAHQTQLNNAAKSNLPAEEKMDVVLTTYAGLMEEGVRFVNPVKGVKYIECDGLRRRPSARSSPRVAGWRRPASRALAA